MGIAGQFAVIIEGAADMKFDVLIIDEGIRGTAVVGQRYSHRCPGNQHRRATLLQQYGQQQTE